MGLLGHRGPHQADAARKPTKCKNVTAGVAEVWRWWSHGLARPEMASLETLLSLCEPDVTTSLAGDEKLLAAMSEVSSVFLAKTKRAVEAVEELSLEATATHVTLQNTLTRVALLANTKFIESVRAFFFFTRCILSPSTYFFLPSLSFSPPPLNLTCILF